MSYETRIFWLVIGIIANGILGYYYFPLRIYFFLFGIVILIMGIVVLVKYHKEWPKVLEKKYAEIIEKKIEAGPDFAAQWQAIRKSMKSDDLHKLRVTVIDADTLVEELLRSQGIAGDTMAALITEATMAGITGTDALLRFHRMRNKIVHESTFTPRIDKLKADLISLDAILVRWGAVLPQEA